MFFKFELKSIFSSNFSYVLSVGSNDNTSPFLPTSSAAIKEKRPIFAPTSMKTSPSLRFFFKYPISLDSKVFKNIAFVNR